MMKHINIRPSFFCVGSALSATEAAEMKKEAKELLTSTGGFGK
jgi:hypothetical protein